LAQSDEINNEIFGELTTYTNMSSIGASPADSFSFSSDFSFVVWRTHQENLLRSAEVLKAHERTHALLLTEHHFHFLELLLNILRARKELERASFIGRFKNESSMERTLRVAMAQGLTADSIVTRAFHWQYFDLNALDLPIPKFASAYDFYAAYDAQELLEPPGYYLVPQDNDAGLEPGWVPVEVRGPATLFISFLIVSLFRKTNLSQTSKLTTTRISAGASEASTSATAFAKKLMLILTRLRRPPTSTVTTLTRGPSSGDPSAPGSSNGSTSRTSSTTRPSRLTRRKSPLKN
jgi:hypothetical protein